MKFFAHSLFVSLVAEYIVCDSQNFAPLFLRNRVDEAVEADSMSAPISDMDAGRVDQSPDRGIAVVGLFCRI